MFLWTVYYKDAEWVCYVIAQTRGRAKSIFADYWKEGEYTDIRCYKAKPADGYDEAIYDYDCEVLAELGVRYMTETEYYAYLEDISYGA